MEQYLKRLKGYIRQQAQPEESITKGYIMDEELGFCMEYMQECNLKHQRILDDKEEPAMNSKGLEGKDRHRLLSAKLRAWIHEFVLMNAEPLQPYKE
jgi:hypothetical protein